MFALNNSSIFLMKPIASAIAVCQMASRSSENKWRLFRVMRNYIYEFPVSQIIWSYFYYGLGQCFSGFLVVTTFQTIKQLQLKTINGIKDRKFLQIFLLRCH